MADAFRVAFVLGVSPDKWASRWRERLPDTPLDLSLVEDDEQRAVLDDGRASVSFVRLPLDREGLHVIPLYDEVSVVVVSAEDELSLLDELTVADLAGAQLVTDPGDLPAWSEIATVERLPFPEMTAKDAIEVVASGTGVAVLPMSLARLHHRKDVVTRVLTDGPEHPVGIAWRRDDEDPRIETFVGIVRGRTANSSRAEETPAQPRKPAAKKTPAKKTAAKPGAGRAGARGAAPRNGAPRKATGRKPKRR